MRVFKSYLSFLCLFEHMYVMTYVVCLSVKRHRFLSIHKCISGFGTFITERYCQELFFLLMFIERKMEHWTPRISSADDFADEETKAQKSHVLCSMFSVPSTGFLFLGIGSPHLPFTFSRNKWMLASLPEVLFATSAKAPVTAAWFFYVTCFAFGPYSPMLRVYS